jgi:hypothetical protein
MLYPSVPPTVYLNLVIQSLEEPAVLSSSCMDQFSTNQELIRPYQVYMMDSWADMQQ